MSVRVIRHFLLLMYDLSVAVESYSEMIYSLGDYEFDTERHELRCAGIPLHIEPKVFELLEYLLQHRGRFIPREELCERLWPEQFISDAALTYCIGRARKALGDSGSAQRVIKTVYGRGYCLIAAVQEYPHGRSTAMQSTQVEGPAEGVATLSDQTSRNRLIPAIQPDLPQVPRDQSSDMLAPLSPPLEAERRQLTVLWCHLDPLSVEGQRLDPEVLFQVIQEADQVCSAAIQWLEGWVAQRFADGFVVYFGYPLAHEDDARRAVRVGLEMVRGLEILSQELRQTRAVECAVQVGIHTGIVIIGGIGHGTQRVQLALGDTPKIAAQLASLAKTNTVLVSATTWQLLAGDFIAERHGTSLLADPAEPLVVYQVSAVSPQPQRSSTEHGASPTPFVGRENELRLLQERWRQSQAGMGQIVLLSGEAGIGKSRLTQVFQQHLADEQYTWLVCYCSPYYQQSPLYPIIHGLQHWLQWQPDDPAPRRLEKLEAALWAVDLAQERGLSLLAALLSLPLPASSPPLPLVPQQQKQQTLEALVRWLARAAEQQPMCVLVEDLHWADPSTLEFLTLLVEQAPLMRLLVLLTYRPEFAGPWVGRSHVTHMVLRRLSTLQTEHMIAQITAGKALPSDFHPQLVEKTNGVPLFIEELSRMILESGLVQEKDGRYELTGPLPSLAIPATLHDSLMARLDRQGTGKQVAQLGAMLGREFSYTLLQAIAPLDEVQLQQGLAQLVRAEILYQRGFPPQEHYVFKHALIQEAAYQSLLRQTRQQYHRQIAMVLAERFPELCQTQPEVLAHHYTEAGLYEQAMTYWLRAGQQALAHSAYIEATQHLSRGLAALTMLPDTPQRLHHELALRTTLGPALMAVQGQTADAVEQTYARAYALCKRIGDSQQLFPVLMGLWRFYGARAKLRMARDLAEQLMRIAQAAQEPELLLEAHMALGNSLFFDGEFFDARWHFEQGIALYEQQPHSSETILSVRDPGVICYSLHALALWKLGYPKRAAHMSHTALARAHEISHPFSLAFADYLASVLAQFQRNPEKAYEFASAASTLATEQELGPWMLGQTTIVQGWALVMQGQGVAGIAHIKQGLKTLQALGAHMPWPLFQLIDAYRTMGQTEEGLQVLDTIPDMQGDANPEGQPPNVTERQVAVEIPGLYWLKGELLLQLPRPDLPQAEACFQQALILARYQGAKADELRVTVSLCRLWQQLNKHQVARQTLAEIYAWFDKEDDTRDLVEARALLETLASA